MDSKFYFSGFVEPARATSDLRLTNQIDSIRKSGMFPAGSLPQK